MYDEAGHLVGEYDSSGNLIQETIWLGDFAVATLRPNGGGVDVFYVHTDQLNTPRKVSRPSDNALRWTWDPTPFGEIAPDQSPASIGVFVFNLRFPGQQFDAETNLNYNYFRDYDLLVGRYVQSDPIGLYGGINTYTYALNDPVSKSDASGLAYIPPGGLAEFNDIVQAAAQVLTGRPPRVPGKYTCYARCPTIPTQCPEPLCPLVYGYGVGPDIVTAKNGSRSDANAKVPRGCQLKHCTYKCTGPKGDAIYPSR